MNPFRQLLRSAGGKPPIGTWISSASPIVAEAVGHAGFDWGLIDMEHAPVDLMGVVHLLQALGNTKMLDVVRLPWNDAVMVKRLLDAGATTLLFPFVQNADEAARAVAATRYPPAGMRGMSGASRASKFGTTPNYAKVADAGISVIVQLETPQALTQIEAIAAVDGVDAIFIGPADLSANMGHTGQFTHPAVMQAMADAALRCKALSMPVGTVGATPDIVTQYRALGYDYLAVSSDLGLLMSGALATVHALRGLSDGAHVHSLHTGTRTEGLNMASAVNRFELHAGAMRLALRPDLGGCIAGLWHRDVPILRSAEPAALSGPRESGSFALLPYSNRLGYRRFRWQGVDHTTQANFEDSAHSLHGVGWLRPWQIVSSSAAEVVLRYRHEPDADWPFAFEARQYIHLTPQLLRAQLVFDNLAEVAQPVGLGWHPYFPKRARSRLHIECAGRWDKDAAQLPVRKLAQAGIDADVRHLDYDHGFDGWRGAARIRDEAMSLQLSSSLDRVVVYTPPQYDYFCVEPVSHVTNAIHMADPLAHGLRSVAPGASTEAWMQLDVRVL